MLGGRTRRRSRIPWLLAIAAAAIILPNILNVPTSEHARVRHSSETFTPDQVRERFRGNGYEIWYSATRDQLLYLVHMGGDYWGGRILAIVRTAGVEHSEITCFARTRDKWQRIIERDGYVRLR